MQVFMRIVRQRLLVDPACKAAEQFTLYAPVVGNGSYMLLMI